MADFFSSIGITYVYPFPCGIVNSQEAASTLSDHGNDLARNTCFPLAIWCRLVGFSVHSNDVSEAFVATVSTRVLVSATENIGWFDALWAFEFGG
jgi:hypothetical protein